MAGGTRTSLPAAMQRVLLALKGGEPLTQNKLVERTGLNFRTVQKIVSMLDGMGPLLKDSEITVSSRGNSKIIQMRRRRGGLESLPEDVQRMIIRAHWPGLPAEAGVLVDLLARGAVSSEASVPAEGGAPLGRMVDAGHVIRSGRGTYHLGGTGRMIAEGALDMYPEAAASRPGMPHAGTWPRAQGRPGTHGAGPAAPPGHTSPRVRAS